MGVDNSMEISTIEKLTQVGREAPQVTFEEIPISQDCEKYNSFNLVGFHPLQRN
jgi:hypothetical protein